MEKIIITDNPKESLKVEYDGIGFLITRTTKGLFPDWMANNSVELDIIEAQRLSSFIQDCILER